MRSEQQFPSDPRPIWFPAKRYGWGWGMPVTWQGWMVMILWYIVVILGAILLAGRSLPAFLAFIVIMVSLLISICYLRGERPRWRWGR
jgi:hypothetical protein